MSRGSAAIDGVALLDKPAGLSSNHALQQLKRHLKAAKAGHAGTLDPMATGLLLVAFGEATKFAQQWLDADKTYTFRVVFGVATDSGDALGTVTETRESAVCAADIEALLPSFHGTITQVPPMVSALKHQGKPLYLLARQGMTVARLPRQVTIYSLRLLAFSETEQRALFQARVSKGTYIRVLAEQIGAALGVPAHIDQLHRDAIGPFTCDAALSLAQWLALSPETAQRRLLPVDRLVGHLPAMFLSAAETERFRSGLPLARVVEPSAAFASSAVVRVYGQSATGTLLFLGMGQWSAEAQLLSPKRVVAKLLPCLTPSEQTLC